MRLSERLAKRIQALEAERDELRAQCEWLREHTFLFGCPPGKFRPDCSGYVGGCSKCADDYLATEPWKEVKSDA